MGAPLRIFRNHRRNLATFTRQMAVLIRAGVPLLRALEIVRRQERARSFRIVISGLARAVSEGGRLSDGMAADPGTFDSAFRSMVRAGEAGGSLPEVFDRLAAFMEKSGRLRRRVRTALVYPIVLLLMAAGILAVLVGFVVPRFEDIFATLLNGEPLPGLTRAVLAACAVAGGKGHLLVAGVLGLAIAGGGFRRTPRGRALSDRMLLRVPLAGTLLHKSEIARFVRTLGTLMESGVPVLSALAISRQTLSNRHLATAIAAVEARVQEGETMARPLAATGLFPELVCGMVEVGEETGTLPEMLGRVADAYEDEVDAAVGVLTALLEPMTIIVMAGVVGTIVVALFLPIVRIVQAMS